MYNNKPVEFQASYQDLLNTLTNQRHGELAAHIQSLTPENRGIFNKILQRIDSIEKVKQNTRASLDDLLKNIEPPEESA